MTLPDTQILSVVQIALIGILVVIGMFLMWRKIQRLEQKIEMFLASQEASKSPCFQPRATTVTDNVSSLPCANAMVCEDTDEHLFDEDQGTEDDDIIQKIFQDGGELDSTTAAFMVFTPYGFNGGTVPSGPSTHHQSNTPLQSSSVEIEELDSTNTNVNSKSSATPTKEAIDASSLVPPKERDIDGMSDVPTERGGLTKTKITRMNVEGLKDILAQHGASTEGTRKQLMDRVLELLHL